MKLRNKRTGEIKDFDYIGGIKVGWCDEMTSYQQYDSLAELNEDWEDYKPTDPLIKDDKIRAIFKMWADNFKNAMIDGTFTFYVDREYNSFMVNLKPTGESHFEDVAELDLNFDCDGLEDGKSYTLAELCGEEEE